MADEQLNRFSKQSPRNCIKGGKRLRTSRFDDFHCVALIGFFIKMKQNFESRFCYFQGKTLTPTPLICLRMWKIELN